MVAAVSLLIALGTGASASAAGVSVTVPCSGSGGGNAGLDAAIVNADTNGGGTITLGAAGAPCTFSFSTAYTNTTVSGAPTDLADWYGPAALPAIAAPITIVGNGSTITRVTTSGTPNFRLFFVGANPAATATPSWTTPGAGTLVLEDLTLSGGLALGGDGDGGGGGGGALGAGGAIYSQGATVLIADTLSGNSAQGGSAAGAGTGTGGGGMGASATSSTGAGFGPGFAEPATSPTGGTGVVGGGGGGAGFGSSENGGTGLLTAGAGGGSLTGTAGDAASGGAKGGDGGGGGASSLLLGGDGGAYGAGGAGAGGGGAGAGGGGTGAGGGFGGGGGAGGGQGGFGAGGGGTGGVAGFGGGAGATSTAVGGGGAGLGGAIFNQQGTLIAENTTLSANTATGGTAGGSGASAGQGLGGAIFSLNGAADVINDTIASNTADQGGALYLIGYDASSASTVGAAALVNNILSGSANASSAGTSDLVVSKPTTVADGTTNLASGVASVPSQNIVGSTTTTGTVSGTPSTANPLLGALANNGGPGMYTMLPSAGSPALKAGTTSGAPMTDERGDARPSGGPIDLGAVQVSAAGSAPTAPVPVAVTGPAKSVTSSAATLTAAIDPEALATTYYFEYGTSTNYGSKSKTGTLPAGSTAVAVTSTISKLKANTTYHFRIVATNANGIGDGLDGTFKTGKQSPAGLTVKTTPLHARAFPYRFKFTGRLRLPKGITNGAACAGKISVVIKRGKKTVSSSRTSLFVGCTYKLSVKLGKRKAVPGHGKLSVTVSFGGNTLLTSRKNKPFTITYG